MIGPELYELEYLFECEAVNEEPKIPWQYGRVSFSLSRGHTKVEFDLEKAMEKKQRGCRVILDSLVGVGSQVLVASWAPAG
ncbi:hypothetical protein [Tumebacillus flagellatus]|uniref:hypothetical protein n=1 Tax=Tumebacillus flagellatus TaxID=1157490 RepID=UPI00126951A6|nr:hypothetical protein [Tumebacillus flagellatus]